ncbi:3-oxoacyl-[acyl-carrier protein] reductase [Alloactinosynnema sp. L-07]|uniref:SDR family NAD(P)-dependent oxidoreductase n=1 Tax=Alloactinosynnema sp. L-07 TaxID=1653480 RepID=UPI00065EF904|nr:SDR family NAD(P)-dependent oxidoreductase [Alloactinosynnema sp. L-07]CRK55999.1 3-oxoacyl-[acyl-carrier protein] reductase [Alloactinosynnema sp. L-07]
MATWLARSKAANWLASPHGRVGAAALREAVNGKIVLVTGASFGLGEATARRLGAAGATVLLVARTRDKLDSVAADITAAGGRAESYPVDLTNPAEVDDLAKAVLERHGHVDVLVSNAGKSIRRTIAQSYDRFHDFERTMGINYFGPVKLMLALLPSMRERGQGHIVNVSTVGVRVPPGPRWAAYQASKGAFDIFFRSAALELAADNISTSSVYMALIRTRMSAPTRIFEHVPGMTADEAAELVCVAIVRKPAQISPWWAGAVQAVDAVTRLPWVWTVGQVYRASRR